ncbi:MAG TPA: hypothetical protein V6D17_23190 [Candidatus Obscuribacterales bacterium]
MAEYDPVEIQKSAENITKQLDDTSKDLSGQAMQDMIDLFRSDRGKFNEVMKKANEMDKKGSGWDIELVDSDKDGNVEVNIRRDDSPFVPNLVEDMFKKISGNYKNVVGTDAQNSGQGFEAARRINGIDY